MSGCYTSNAALKKMQQRTQGDAAPNYPDVLSIDALDSIYTIHSKNDECSYFWVLLVNVRGPTSFESTNNY